MAHSCQSLIFYTALDLRRVFFGISSKKERPEPQISLFCTTCHTGVNRILKANTTTQIFELAINLCVDLGLGPQLFCEGIVTMSEVCNTILHFAALKILFLFTFKAFNYMVGRKQCRWKRKWYLWSPFCKRRMHFKWSDERMDSGDSDW